MRQIRIADAGIQVGILPKGPRNKISDVSGVRVGHCTLDEGRCRTGVTVILPGRDNPFFHKPVAAMDVLNGYAKPAGLVQIEELGTLETPIALCGTLGVGLVQDALVQIMLEACAGDTPPTSINPVVCECNDGRLSDISLRPVRAKHVRAACEASTEDFAEGSVGAGKGMICHGLKGGVGSASRLVALGGETYTLGLLALTNHGRLEDLTIDGKRVGSAAANSIGGDTPERGSAILVIATDLPVNARQLRRILRRAPVGLARLGSYTGHGSGEILLGFTTANHVPFEEGPAVRTERVLREDLLDIAFRAAAECAEEAVLNSMFCADTTTGCKGDVIVSLRDLWDSLA